MSGKELAVYDQSCAHAGSDEESDDLCQSLGRAVFPLTVYADVNVISDKERYLEFLFDRFFDLVVSPGKIRREKHHSLFDIDDARGTCRDRRHIFNGDLIFGDQLFNKRNDRILDILGIITACLCLFLHAVHDLALAVEDNAQHLGAADIQTNIILGHIHFSFRFSSSSIKV